MTDATDKPDWDELKELIRWFAVIFGQPTELLGELAIERRIGLIVSGWLCGLEAYTRGLLVIMATALPKPAQQRRTPSRKTDNPSTDSMGACGLDREGADLTTSEHWTGVSFPLLPPKRPEIEDRLPAKGGLPFVPTRRMAFRLEALIRVAKAPDRYAARMARRLWAAPKLAVRILRKPNSVGCRTAPREPVDRALAFARSATDVFGAVFGTDTS